MDSNNKNRVNVVIKAAIITGIAALLVPVIDRVLQDDDDDIVVERTNATINYKDEIKSLEQLHTDIQSEDVSEKEKKRKINELGEKFTILVNNVDDCDDAILIYDFAREELIPNYNFNDNVIKVLTQIEDRCLK